MYVGRHFKQELHNSTTEFHLTGSIISNIMSLINRKPVQK